MRKNKVDVITLGCSKNLVDSEVLLQLFAQSGYTVDHDPKVVNGEIVVINTCGFIEAARQESIDMILNVLESKKAGQVGKVYVMGCLSERYLSELQEALPEVDGYYGKFNWKELVHDLGKAYHNDVAVGRLITTPHHYAYVKISEGCNRHCAYCSIPLMTGPHVSRPMDSIVAEVESMAQRGVKELQLIAQDLTYYGRDIYGSVCLPELVTRLSRVEGIEWIRLHYAYPYEFPMELLQVIRQEPKVCNYLDIALQHISDPMLEKMRRHVTKQQTLDLLRTIRQEVPGIHLRTTLMVGHPGETEEDFEELKEFVVSQRFERLGAFMYSHEEGTYGYRHYEDNIPSTLKQERLDEIMTLQESIAFEVAAKKVGDELKVIIDRKEGDYYVGRSEYDSPDVDPEVLIPAEAPLEIGRFYHTKIVDQSGYDLIGKVSL